MVSPELLRRYTFFSGMTDAELVGIALLAKEVEYRDGDRIFSDGELARDVFVLLSGAVELFHRVEEMGEMRDVHVGSIAVGEPFAISAFMEPYRLTASAKADGAVQAIKIDTASLRAMSEVDCHLGYTLMRQITKALGQRLSFARVQLAACNHT